MATTKRPYQLPKPLTVDPETLMDASGNLKIDMAIVDKFIRLHEATFRRYEYLENLYLGFHDVFKLPEKEEWKQDNRLAVNFPRYMTDTFAGYGYGIPIKVSHPDEAVDEAVQNFCRDNEMTDHDSEMIKRCCIYGHAYEYIYQDEEARTKVTALTPKDLLIVYDDTMRQRALFAVRYGRHRTSGAYDGILFGEILTRDYIRSFDAGKLGEVTANPYRYIPVVEWRINDERLGLFENAAGLIEVYNRTIGEKANDVDSFAEAYLAIMGAPVDADGVRRIRDDRLINIYGTDNAKDVLVQFLQKPSADGTQENLLNRLENLIYQTSMIANISDDTFGNSTSGTALAYKLQSMSNLAKTFDRKIEKSLRKRYKIFCSLSTNVSDPRAYADLSFQFSRNLPRNLLEEAQTAQALDGIVSRESQLKVLSIVDSPKEEVKRMEDEDPKQGVLDEMFEKTGQQAGTAPEGGAEIQGKALNGAQTQALIAIIGQFSAGQITEGQAIRLISAAIGVSREDAGAILRGDM